jgi:methylthioribose-1-phosphate isomerase
VILHNHMKDKIDPPRALWFDDATEELVLLDQSALPGEIRHIRTRDPGAVRDAIRELKVRGAPAIGIAAAYGAYLGALAAGPAGEGAVSAGFEAAHALLLAARPTAVNLRWALDRMARRLHAVGTAPRERMVQALRAEADAILEEDRQVCLRIGENGLGLLQKGWGILTHCNAGALATGGIGTALAPLYLGTRRGYGFRVFADETRPLLQGARLTAWELSRAGIEVTLICDNMASALMASGKVQAVSVGADRIAANGDTANKIGTSGAAILARHYGIPFHVHAPLSTFDQRCAAGSSIPIEERPAEEITERWYARRMAPAGVKAWNPAFDVTDHALITAIVTERGVVRPPFDEGIRALFE